MKLPGFIAILQQFDLEAASREHASQGIVIMYDAVRRRGMIQGTWSSDLYNFLISFIRKIPIRHSTADSSIEITPC